jgi:hypothetical protein
MKWHNPAGPVYEGLRQLTAYRTLISTLPSGKAWKDQIENGCNGVCSLGKCKCLNKEKENDNTGVGRS